MSDKKQVIYRCPVCFSRENDVVLHKAEHGYYCVKCSFSGTEDDIREMYASLQKKYRMIERRITLSDLENNHYTAFEA